MAEADDFSGGFAQVAEFFATEAAVRGHPALDEAIRHSVRSALAYFGVNPTLHRSVKDIGRLALAVIALHLDHTGGLTHRRLREVSGLTGVLSAGTATAVLFRLRSIGYVTREEGGRGVKARYRPTPQMIDTFRSRMRIELTSTAMVVPKVAPVLRELDRNEVFGALISAFGRETMVAARQPRGALDGLNQLMARSAGMLILYEILDQADRATGMIAPPVEVGLSVAGTARRFEVSRSHVLNVLRTLEEQGYLQRGELAGRWRLTPWLGEQLRDLFAVIYAGMAFCAYEALPLTAAE